MELGRLESVPLRDVWTHEAHHFTPWLLGQADRLSEALGMDLELTAAEHPVGGFSLDLIGRDLSHDAVVIVENQLEATDHTHLGQLLTYAAGTSARTIIWIAAEFREEHRQAVDWLNSIIDEDTHIFGVEVRVVRIGDSVPAPLFDVVAEPNDWQKRFRSEAAAGELTARQGLYRQFWTRYLERVHVEHPGWTRAKLPQKSNWMDAPSKIRGTHFASVFGRGDRLRSELYVDTGDADETMELFSDLLAHREPIEAAFGGPLIWDELEGRRASSVYVLTEGSVENEDAHESYIDWFFDQGVRFRRAVDAYLEAAGRI